MNILDEDVFLILVLTMQVAVALLAQIKMLPSFERIIEGNQLSILGSTAITFTFP